MTDKWFDEKNNILADDMNDLIRIARTRQFGESENESLISFLLCEAFEARLDRERSRAFHLAAMIISRVPYVD